MEKPALFMILAAFPGRLFEVQYPCSWQPMAGQEVKDTVRDWMIMGLGYGGGVYVQSTLPPMIPVIQLIWTIQVRHQSITLAKKELAFFLRQKGVLFLDEIWCISGSGCGQG